MRCAGSVAWYLIFSRKRLNSTNLAATIFAMPRLDVNLCVVFQMLDRKYVHGSLSIRYGGVCVCVYVCVCMCVRVCVHASFNVLISTVLHTSVS